VNEKKNCDIVIKKPGNFIKKSFEFWNIIPKKNAWKKESIVLDKLEMICSSLFNMNEKIIYISQKIEKCIIEEMNWTADWEYINLKTFACWQNGAKYCGKQLYHKFCLQSRVRLIYSMKTFYTEWQIEVYYVLIIFSESIKVLSMKCIFIFSMNNEFL
jgi:hypothetical protein